MGAADAKPKPPVTTPIREFKPPQGLSERWRTVLIAGSAIMVGFAALYFFGAFDESPSDGKAFDDWEW